MEYKVFTEQKSWFDALRTCMEIGFNLAHMGASFDEELSQFWVGAANDWSY